MQTDAEFLREALLRAACEADALVGESDEYGDRFTVDFELTRGIGVPLSAAPGLCFGT
jgi:hypothetical protein